MKNMVRSTVNVWQWTIAALLALGSLPALGNDAYQTPPPPPPMSTNGVIQGGPENQAPSTSQYGPTIGVEPTRTPGSYNTFNNAWPPPGEDARSFGNPYNAAATASPPPYSACLPPANSTSVASIPSITAGPLEKISESTLYFREDAYFWHEQIGPNSVNESGPLSTLGYMHRSGIERWRGELFGGSMNYDGFAQYDDNSTEAYSQSNGTNYLGLRGEYELLIEPSCCDFLRFYIGFGTRFWVRDLKDSWTPTDHYVEGYQECWWTFYPYVGFETRESCEPGPHFYTSARVGVTPLTYESIAYYGLAMYPRCGVTAQAELGIRFQKFLMAATVETMTWNESPVVDGSFQPNSSLLTVGGKIAYTF